jgi:hypothetical protein
MAREIRRGIWLDLRHLDSEALVGGCWWDDGKLIVRLYNPSYRDVSSSIALPSLHIGRAWLADLIGRPKRELRSIRGMVELSVPARSVVTFLIEGRKR